MYQGRRFSARRPLRCSGASEAGLKFALALAGVTRCEFRQADVLAVDLEETDLLFINTWHVSEQLQEELRRHGGKARRYLVLHDTTTFGERGEAEGRRGLWPAVAEFLSQGSIRLKQRSQHNHRLTVLERK